MLAKERSMGIVVVMNELALELLPRVPSFALQEMRKNTAGTQDTSHHENGLRRPSHQAVNEVRADKSGRGSRKRRKTRMNANKARCAAVEISNTPMHSTNVVFE
jgi:hypothetical protein